jgi:uncharacterized phage protein gp47/JayE
VSFTPIYTETDETVRARLLASVPEGMSTEVGSFGRDWIEINVAEKVRIWAQLNYVMSQMFVRWATGQLLEAHGVSYGIARSTGTYATGVVRFFAPEGTSIPPATIVEVPQTDPNAERLRYLTVNPISAVTGVPGYVDVPIRAVNVGALYNQAVGAVSLLDSQVDGVSELTNTTPLTNGSDADDDPALRAKVIAEAALPVGSGTKQDYVVWGLEVPGVGDVAVYPLWDTSGDPPGSGSGNGSVLLSLRDASLVPVDWSVVQAAQQHLDPSRQMLAVLDAGEPWSLLSGDATITWESANKQIGAHSLAITFPRAADTAIVELIRPTDLSRFLELDDLSIWLYSTNWSTVTSVKLRLVMTDADFYEADITSTSTTGTPAPTTGGHWWEWRVSKSQFAVTGEPAWSGIARIQLEVESSAGSGAVVLADYLHAEARTGATGLGRAPISARATVITPNFKLLDIELTDVVLAPGYTLTDVAGRTNALTLLRENYRAFFRTQQPGGLVKMIDLANVAHDAPGILNFVLSSPTTDTLLAPSEYAQLGELRVTT